MSLEALTAISRFYGADSDYVIAGGGNTSFKDDAALYIKGSGTALASVEPSSFVRMDRAALSRIWERTYSANSDEREQAVLADLMAARMTGEEDKRPSVETLLHDILPFAFVVHTHPALVNGLTCSREGEWMAVKLFGESATGGAPAVGESAAGGGIAAVWIPSINPGYVLSRAVKEALDAYTARTGKPGDLIFLQNHGVFVGADDIEGIKTRYREIMEKIGAHIKRQPDLSGECSSWGGSERIAALLAERAAAGGDAPWTALFLRNREIAGLVHDREAFAPVSSAFTPDHIVYAGSDPLFIPLKEEKPPAAYIERVWEEHIQKTGRVPRIAAVQGMGVFGLGASVKAAQTALALFTDAVKVAVYAASFGGPLFMSREKIDFINNWEVERYRSQVSGA
jgi:rhamnose utilization protein RhaD (predicted bifunctional aldolase and dehydrogenase)